MTPYRGGGGGPNRTAAYPLPATHPVSTMPERAAPNRSNLFISLPPNRSNASSRRGVADSKVLLTLLRINARRSERCDTGERRSVDDEVSLDSGTDSDL